jgi:hypothetical protein
MALEKNEIVEIPPNRIKFFGGPGKMLLPSVHTVAAVVGKIPPQSLLTTSLLRLILTQQFDVQGTCPVTTKHALIAITNDPGRSVPYWRVINQDGGLISQFPGGVDQQAALLRQEGFTIESKGKSMKVKDFKRRLVSPAS